MNSFLQSFRCTSKAFIAILAVGSALNSSVSLAQSATADSASVDRSPSSTPHVERTTDQIQTSVSIGSMAQLTATRISDTTTNLTTQSLEPSAGVFTTFRQNFNPWLGYSVNFGYTEATSRYTISPPVSSTGTGPTSRMFVPAHTYEISVSYIAQKRLTNRLTVFGEAGGGTVAFSASNHAGYTQNRSNAFSPEGIAGFGMDYRLPHGFGLRAQYRGLFVRYPYPDYILSPRLKTIVSEPTLSLTYSFGSHAYR